MCLAENNVFQYKEFKTEMCYDDDDKLFYGKITNIDDLVCFDGKTKEEFKEHFHSAVDDYIDITNKIGKKIEIKK
jgi:predicted HicB family RNase H-like nuclease